MNIIPDNYIKTFSLLKDRIIQTRYKSVMSVNKEMIFLYLEIGKTISQQVKNGWGSSVIDRLSKDLRAEFTGLKGFSSRNLYRMKLVFEEISKNQISPQLVAKLPWGHTSLIFSKIKVIEQRSFYLEKAIEYFYAKIKILKIWRFLRKKNLKKNKKLMRISKEKLDFLRKEINLILKNCKIYLFGSRVDDLQKGGDIDILILSKKKINLSEKLKIKRKFYKKFGEQKIDIVNFQFDEKNYFKDLILSERKIEF